MKYQRLNLSLAIAAVLGTATFAPPARAIDVQAGVVYLRGEAPSEWIERFATGARAVDGIQGVKNLLHTPGTPTPAPEPRFLAAEHYHRS